LKIGLGGTTITAAKNVQAQGLDLLMLTSIEDIAVFKPVAGILGDKFYFVASPQQVYEALLPSPQKEWIGSFLKVWRAKYGDRDPNAAGRGWDAVMIWAAAVKRAGTTAGPAVRDALEATKDFQGTTGVFTFTGNHYGLNANPYVIAHIVNGKVELAR
jgi:ABC-type multidrug transport system fused ATPase/permease subunit